VAKPQQKNRLAGKFGGGKIEKQENGKGGETAAAQSGKPQPNEGNHEWTRMNTNPKERELNGHKKAQEGTKNRRAKFRRSSRTIWSIAVRRSAEKKLLKNLCG